MNELTKVCYCSVVIHLDYTLVNSVIDGHPAIVLLSSI
jgi:hypothetical protein